MLLNTYASLFSGFIRSPQYHKRLFLRAQYQNWTRSAASTCVRPDNIWQQQLRLHLSTTILEYGCTVMTTYHFQETWLIRLTRCSSAPEFLSQKCRYDRIDSILNFGFFNTSFGDHFVCPRLWVYVLWSQNPTRVRCYDLLLMAGRSVAYFLSRRTRLFPRIRIWWGFSGV